MPDVCLYTVSLLEVLQSMHYITYVDAWCLYTVSLKSSISFQNNSLEIIQKEWFKVSSSKLADAHQNEDYLSCFNEISKRLLEYIVNMQDSNVSAVHLA